MKKLLMLSLLLSPMLFANIFDDSEIKLDSSVKSLQMTNNLSDVEVHYIKGDIKLPQIQLKSNFDIQSKAKSFSEIKISNLNISTGLSYDSPTFSNDRYSISLDSKLNINKDNSQFLYKSNKFLFSFTPSFNININDNNTFSIGLGMYSADLYGESNLSPKFLLMPKYKYQNDNETLTTNVSAYFGGLTAPKPVLLTGDENKDAKARVLVYGIHNDLKYTTENNDEYSYNLDIDFESGFESATKENNPVKKNITETYLKLNGKILLQNLYKNLKLEIKTESNLYSEISYNNIFEIGSVAKLSYDFDINNTLTLTPNAKVGFGYSYNNVSSGDILFSYGLKSHINIINNLSSDISLDLPLDLVFRKDTDTSNNAKKLNVVPLVGYVINLTLNYTW